MASGGTTFEKILECIFTAVNEYCFLLMEATIKSKSLKGQPFPGFSLYISLWCTLKRAFEKGTPHSI